MTVWKPFAHLGSTTHHVWEVEGPERKTFHQRYWLKDTERREFLETMSTTALIVFEYLLRQASLPEAVRKQQPLHDALIAKTLGFTERNVKKIRLELEKEGWLLRDKTPKGKKGHSMEMYRLRLDRDTIKLNQPWQGEPDPEFVEEVRRMIEAERGHPTGRSPAACGEE